MDKSQGGGKGGGEVGGKLTRGDLTKKKQQPKQRRRRKDEITEIWKNKLCDFGLFVLVAFLVVKSRTSSLPTLFLARFLLQ